MRTIIGLKAYVRNYIITAHGTLLEDEGVAPF